MLCRDTQPARLFVFLNGVILLRVLSPVPGEGKYYHLTGGYASLTPGYHRLTRSGLIKWSRASARLGITQKIRGQA